MDRDNMRTGTENSQIKSITIIRIELGPSEQPEKCLHCGAAYPSRPRGLCSRCYDNNEIKEKYPRRSTARHYKDSNRQHRNVPPQATQAIPGTEEKVKELAWREANHFLLWHPNDCVLERQPAYGEAVRYAKDPNFHKRRGSRTFHEYF
jgi:hypothetical protein